MEGRERGGEHEQVFPTVHGEGRGHSLRRLDQERRRVGIKACAIKAVGLVSQSKVKSMQQTSAKSRSARGDSTSTCGPRPRPARRRPRPGARRYVLAAGAPRPRRRVEGGRERRGKAADAGQDRRAELTARDEERRSRPAESRDRGQVR